jgi:trigger factor
VKVTTERLPKSIVAIDVELDQQQVQKGLDRAARKLSQQFRIPGFRPGKAPRQIVENYFGRERLLEEASDDLIQKSFPEALKQEQIVPVGRPTLENVEQQPFRYRVSVPVEPTVELPEYTGYGLSLDVEEVSDEQVQKLLDAQREQHVVLQELDEPRPAQLGDQVSVTITSDLDDDELDDEDLDDDEFDDDQIELVEEEEGDVEAEVDAELDELEDDEVDELDAEDELEAEDEAGQEQQIALVEGRTRPEILEALVGAQPGETRTVTISYGDDEESEALRGRDVSYTLKVNNVQERLLPDWEELPTLTEFEGDFEALRANARERLERAAETKARQEVVNTFLERLESETELDIPDAMIEERAAELFHAQFEQFSRQFGISEDQYLQAVGKSHEEATAEFNEQAAQDMRRSLVLRALIERENLSIDDADLAEERERLLEGFDPTRREEMAKLLDQPQMRQSIQSSALDRKLNDRLVALATGQAEAAPSQPQADAVSTASAEAAAAALVNTDEPGVAQTAVGDEALVPSEADEKSTSA